MPRRYVDMDGSEEVEFRELKSCVSVALGILRKDTKIKDAKEILR